MPVSRRRHDAIVLEIHEDRERMRRQLAAAEEQLRVEQSARTTMARQLHDLTEDNIGQSRLIADQQRQLDSLLGMDDPAVAAGAGWQARRPDKPKPAAPVDREPGEVAP